MKTRSLRLKKGKSKKFRMKRGGQKNMPSQSGGAPALNTTLDMVSVKSSLDSFGNSISSLNNAYISAVNAATQHMVTAEADVAASQSLVSATQSLYDAFFGAAAVGDALATVGLYNTLILGAGPTATIVTDRYNPTTGATTLTSGLPTTDKEKQAAYDAALAIFTADYKAAHTGSPPPTDGPGSFPNYIEWQATTVDQ